MIDDDSKENKEDIEIKESYWLTRESEGKNMVFDTILTGSEIGTDETKRNQLENALKSNAKSNVGITTFIETKNNIIIKKLN
jgi:hypothetical protein